MEHIMTWHELSIELLDPGFTLPMILEHEDRFARIASA